MGIDGKDFGNEARFINSVRRTTKCQQAKVPKFRPPPVWMAVARIVAKFLEACF